MAKVLLVDTNLSSSPIYKFLVSEGYSVAVIGGNPNDYLARSAPWYIEGDYSDNKFLESVVDEHLFDYIVPGCNDRSYHACAELNCHKNFPGVDSLKVTEIINNKRKFRAFAEVNGLPVPKVYEPDACPLNRPLIVKPVDAFSGRGVTILKMPTESNIYDAINYANQASVTSSCVIEDYVSGQLFSHSCFISSQKILFDFVVEEHGTANPFVVDTSRVIWNFPSEVLQRIRSSIQLMAGVLGLVDGLVHTQFMFDGGSFWLIEVTRRCPGDLYSQLIEMATGFPYAEYYARKFVDLDYPRIDQNARCKFVMRHTMSLPHEANLEHLRFNVPILFDRIYPMAKIGEEIKRSPDSRIGLIFVSAENGEDFDGLFQRTLKRELYSVEDLGG
ncbi:MAG: acetyl-CoA carboxylase biotin carboxylase subunit family protein [Azonexus sp.]